MLTIFSTCMGVGLLIMLQNYYRGLDLSTLKLFFFQVLHHRGRTKDYELVHNCHWIFALNVCVRIFVLKRASEQITIFSTMFPSSFWKCGREAELAELLSVAFDQGPKFSTSILC